MERHKVTWLRQLLAAFVFDRLQDWWSARIVFAATKEARLGRENEFQARMNFGRLLLASLSYIASQKGLRCWTGEPA